jgi:hypothetical protein
MACATCPSRPDTSTAGGSPPRTSPPIPQPGPRLLGCCDDKDLRDADPDILRYRIWYIPAKPARHARQRTLAISPYWSWRGTTTSARSSPGIDGFCGCSFVRNVHSERARGVSGHGN